ncbi:hypothetical protein P692DRAFT_20645627, partial [Suillus brevipes Sb2]
MPSDRKQVVVLYAETKLQKSIDLPGSATAANAKEEAMVAIRDHLIHILPGVPPISLDPDCTDFYPATKDETTVIRSLKGNLTIIVYPEPPKGQRLTQMPSPFVDAFQSAICGVCGVQAQKNVASLNREENAKHNVKPADNDALLRRFEAMEEIFEKFGRANVELRRENAGLKHDVEELKGENVELRRENAGLKHSFR